MSATQTTGMLRVYHRSGLVLLFLLVSLVMTGCARPRLLEKLDERQANEVVALLLRHNIASEKVSMGKGGYGVTVAAADIPEAVELMQRERLPSAPRTQIAASFPADALVSTPLGERARLMSAIEQRLEESISVIAGVQAARVHVSYDADIDGEGRRRGRPMHLAAVVAHHPGVDEEVLLQSIKRFLRNTFDGIEYDNVSVLLTQVHGPDVLAVTPEGGGGGGWGVWAVVTMACVLGVALLAGLAIAVSRSGRLSAAEARRIWSRASARTANLVRRRGPPDAG